MNRALTIGVLRLGGLGDNINSTAILTGIRRKFPNSRITFYCREYADTLRGFSCVDEVICVGNVNWWKLVENERLKYDIFYDLRYAVRAYFSSTVEKQFSDYKSRCDAKFKEYEKFYEEFPRSSSQIWQLGKTHFELASDTMCLDFNEDDQFIELLDSDNKLVREYEGRRIITVHDWADLRKQTKCWYQDRWVDVVKFILKAGYLPIQVGKSGEDPIPGAISALGRGSIHEVAALIRRARLHLDIEGGLVHVARAVGTKSIVLFGPTPESMFAYKRNINLCAVDKVCSPCFWKNNSWHLECVESKDKACMKEITPDMVIDALQKEVGDDFKNVERPIRKPTKVAKPQRILVKRSAAFGDVLMTTPTIRGIKEKFPESTIDVATLPQFLGVFANNKKVESAVNSQGSQGNYDLVFNLDGAYENHPQRATKHLVDIFCDTCDVIPDERTLELNLVEDDLISSKRVWEKEGVNFSEGEWVGLHVRSWSFSNSKNIPHEYYRDVISELNKIGYKVALLGGKGEYDQSPSDGCKSLVGKTDVRTLASTIKKLKFVIGPDSGILHVAASQKVPFIGIYGPAKPQTLAPYGGDFIALYSGRECAPCLQSNCPLGTIACMKDITPQMIMSAVGFRRKIGSKKLSVVIAILNQLEYVKKCVESVEKNTDVDYELILVDNHSTESGIREYLTELSTKHKVIFESENTGVGKAWNRGIRNSLGQYLCVLNSDTEVSPGWARIAIEDMEKDPNIGVVGAKLLYPNGTIQHAGQALLPNKSDYAHIYHRKPGNYGPANVPKEYPSVTGAVHIFRRSDYFSVGGYEERYFAYCEDTDFCLKMRYMLGRIVWYDPRISIIHHEAKTSRTVDLTEKRKFGFALFQKKWLRRLKDEPVGF